MDLGEIGHGIAPRRRMDLGDAVSVFKSSRSNGDRAHEGRHGMDDCAAGESRVLLPGAEPTTPVRRRRVGRGGHGPMMAKDAMPQWHVNGERSLWRLRVRINPLDHSTKPARAGRRRGGRRGDASGSCLPAVDPSGTRIEGRVGLGGDGVSRFGHGVGAGQVPGTTFRTGIRRRAALAAHGMRCAIQRQRISPRPGLLPRAGSCPSRPERRWNADLGNDGRLPI